MMLEPDVEGILCGKNNMTEFADAIEKLAKDQSLRVSMGKAAHDKAVRDYSTETQIRKYQRTFSEALNAMDYMILQPKNDIEHFVVPESTKPHILARILPLWFKKILKKII